MLLRKSSNNKIIFAEIAPKKYKYAKLLYLLVCLAAAAVQGGDQEHCMQKYSSMDKKKIKKNHTAKVIRRWHL